MAAVAAGHLDRLAARREGLADDAGPIGQHARLGHAAAARGRIEHLAEQVGQATQAAAAAHRLAARGERALRWVADPAWPVHRVRSTAMRGGDDVACADAPAHGSAPQIRSRTILRNTTTAVGARPIFGAYRVTRGQAIDRLLDWYDRHRRPLPWRAAPGRAARSLSRALERGDAAADHGGDRGGPLRGLPGAVSEPERARRSGAGGRAACLAGARLLSARPCPARLRRGGRPALRRRVAAQRERAARAARHRRLHGARDPRHRVRPAHGAGGCQRRPRARAPARHRDAAAARR